MTNNKTNNLKIISVGPAYPLRGGISNFNVALSCAFNNNDNNVCKIFSFSLQYPKFLFPGKTQFEDGKPPKNIEIISKINSINPFSWFKVARLIKKENPDIVIVHYWMPFMAPSLGTIVRKIRKKNKTKIIAITHNVIPHEKRMGDKMLTKYFLKSCDAYIALAKSVENDIGKFIDNPVSAFNPHPIYDIFGENIPKAQAREFLKLKENDKIILFFGLIRDYKGLDLLLNALGNNNLKELNIKLLVAGEFYEDRSKYKKLIDSLNIGDNVILVDKYIPSEEVKYYFSAADLIAQTYKTATQSGVTQIGYHFNKPMLVTNVGGLAEIIPDKKVGYVVEPNSNAIAEAIVDFYKNKREEEFSINASIEKKKYSWENMIDTIIALFNNIHTS